MFSKFLSALLAAVALWCLALACEARGSDLDDAYALAEKNGKPVVIFVATEMRKVPGAISVWVPGFGGYGSVSYAVDSTPRVLVARQGASYLDRLHATATDAEILAAAFPRARTVSKPVSFGSFRRAASC